ncbi:MAG: gamma carbonic anhydrase family protein [Alistipes sp.]|jgi:carbonic anhydrase/acetyltransferase-like protein (isoleucine patch superfamily)|nr:gamma carbonic anhydrase family protein [Alistipes sp.]
MAVIRSVRGKTPKVGENTFVAETAVLTGDVTVGRDCSIWYGAVLRGDVNTITVGDRTNIQDGAVIHTLYDASPVPSQTHIGSDVSVGHNAIIHGATIEDNCLVGMGATILDNAVVASGCIIAANALVLSNARLEPNSVYAGVPARKVKEISVEQSRDIVRRTADDYRLYASWYCEEA